MKTQRDTDKKVIALIKMGNKILETAVEGHQKQYLNEKKFHDFRISALSFLSVTFGVTSQFYKEFSKEVTHPTPTRTERALGILTAAQRELQGDWLVSMKTEVYGKFERGLLINAKRQLSEGKKLSALVLSMNLLESRLQNFSLQNEMPVIREFDGKSIPYTAVQLNSRLYKKGLYERKTNKSIFTWLEIQQKASDDGIDSVSEEQINKLIDGIILFTINYPTEPAE